MISHRAVWGALALSIVGCTERASTLPSFDAGVTSESDAGPADAGAPPDATSDAGLPPLPYGTSFECREAARTRANVGCEYLPVPSMNPVPSINPFAVVVTNVSERAGFVRVTRGTSVVVEREIASGEVARLDLPWIPELKLSPDRCEYTGPLTDPTTGELVIPSSTVQSGYRLESTIPVVAWQYSPINARRVAGCEGSDDVSFTNDASLLLPVHALSSLYRLDAYPVAREGGTLQPGLFVVTGTRDDTDVEVRLGPATRTRAGESPLVIPAGNPGDVLRFRVDAGQPVQILVDLGSALSGTLVRATQPIQVLTGSACELVPREFPACDHLEELAWPATALGTEYVVPRPTGPQGTPVPHVVRIVANFDDTELTYEGTPPPGAPTTLDAGETADLGVVRDDFIVRATASISVSSFLVGTIFLEDPNGWGDPSQTFVVPVSQYIPRARVLTPATYDASFVDIIAPSTVTRVRFDGSELPLPAPGVGGYRVLRVPATDRESHDIEAEGGAVSVQLLGYAPATSYAVPGGLFFEPISPEPLF